MSGLDANEKLDMATFEDLMNNAGGVTDSNNNNKTDIVSIIKTIFSLDFLPQKSRLSLTNAEGLIEVKTYVDYYKNKYLFTDRVAEGFRHDTLEILQSVDGWKTDKFIQAFQPIKQDIDEKERSKSGIFRI